MSNLTKRPSVVYDIGGQYVIISQTNVKAMIYRRGSKKSGEAQTGKKAHHKFPKRRVQWSRGWK